MASIIQHAIGVFFLSQRIHGFSFVKISILWVRDALVDPLSGLVPSEVWLDWLYSYLFFPAVKVLSRKLGVAL